MGLAVTSLTCLQRLVELAEVREGVLQQLQCLEAIKMHMAEQKLAEQARLCSDLDVRLQAACATLDVSAGMPLLAKTVPTGQFDRISCFFGNGPRCWAWGNLRYLLAYMLTWCVVSLSCYQTRHMQPSNFVPDM